MSRAKLDTGELHRLPVTDFKMANNSSWSQKNEQTSAHIVLQFIVNEWKNNQKTYDNIGALMRTCFKKCGISHLGPEALQIHMTLFQDLFMRNESNLPCIETELGFCVRDYFTLLRDEQLGWISFLTQMLPYFRLSKANNFLGRLTQFLKTDVTPAQNQTDIQLFLSPLLLVNGIILDFLLASQRVTVDSGEIRENETISQPSDSPCNQNNIFKSNLQTLASHLAEHVQSLQHLFCSEQLSSLVAENKNLLRQLVENLIFSSVVFNPYFKVEEKAKLLFDSYIGKIYVPDADKAKKGTTKNNRREQKRHLGLQDKLHFVWTDIKLKQSKNGLKGNVQHEKSFKNLDGDKVASMNVDKVESVFKNLDNIESTFQNVDEITVDSDIKLQFSTFNHLVNGLLSNTPTTMFVDLISWITQSDDKNSCKGYTKTLANIFCGGRDIYIGRHVISGKFLFSWFIEFLQDLQNRLLVPINNVEYVSVLQTLIEKVLVPGIFCDISSIKTTQLGFLELINIPIIQEDIELFKEAVMNKRPGWTELLKLGLVNTDINGWWKAGFFCLAWDNEAALSSEKNVRLVLHILCHAYVESHDADFCRNVSRLFDIMFKRLPTVLQEQVVLYALDPSCHKGSTFDLVASRLPHVLGREDVVESLTPILNRLTSANADKMVGHILYLCLFDANVVIQKALQVAVENKAQVLPIVQVLRQMFAVCCFCEPKTNQSKLFISLQKVLSGIDMSDKKADNIIRTLCLCAEKYSLDIDVDNENHITQKMTCLLSTYQIFQNVIRPSLDFGDASEVTARLKKQENVCFNLPGKNQKVEDQVLLGGHVKDDESNHCTESEKVNDYDNKKLDISNRFSSDSQVTIDGVYLPLDVALKTLSAILERADLLDVMSIKPFPLLVMLADIYARNCNIFHNGDLNKHMLQVKQACLQSITLLTAVVWKYSSSFTETDFLWLKQRAVMGGWLCTAVLKPVLNIGCDVELHNTLSSLASHMMMLQENNKCGTRGLVMLMQLSVINDETLSDVLSVVKQSQMSAGHSQLLLAVGCILASSLPTEMYRLVKIIMLLLANQDQPFPIGDSLLLTDADADVYQQIKASQLLTDTVLQLSTSELTAGSWCHVVSNYQAAQQSLLQQRPDGFILQIDVFCHCCMVMSVTEGQAGHLLQVLAMKILTELKAYWSNQQTDQNETKHQEESKHGCYQSFRLVGRYIECVSEDSLRGTLRASLLNKI